MLNLMIHLSSILKCLSKKALYLKAKKLTFFFHCSAEVMERSRNRIRIRLANIMIVATIFGCVVMVISGKAAQGRGESLTKRNLEWHKKFNEDAAAASTPKPN